MKYYIPFHLAFGAAVLQYQPRVIVAVHSFNPVYEVCAPSLRGHGELELGAGGRGPRTPPVPQPSDVHRCL